MLLVEVGGRGGRGGAEKRKEGFPKVKGGICHILI